MGEQGKQRGRGVVLVPCPFQGHITPMLQLGTILHSMGFTITIAHPKFNSPNPSNYPELTFLPLPDGLTNNNHVSSGDDLLGILTKLNTNCKQPLEESLVQMMEQQEPHDQISCIIYDVAMHFSQGVANDLNLLHIVLHTGGATSVLGYDFILQLRAQGHVPFRDSILQDIVPGFHPLRYEDLPLTDFGSLEAVLQVMFQILCTIRSSSAAIWNTMDFLEYSSLQKLKQQCNINPFFSIGPLHKIAPTSSSSLLEEDNDCIKWLDKQAPKSVIYVSLGSLASLDERSLSEMAWGLANSYQPFLWVVRPGSVLGSEWQELLPKEFKEIVGERGYVVKWAPQMKVLGHGSVGGFWSHCGWNSTLESVCEGVPMVCWPCFGDQKVNARLLSHVWRVGIELEHELERGKIERAVRRVMVEREGEEMRKRVVELKEKIEICVREGGSSNNSLNDLAQFILS